jgi:uncharacterized protein
MTTVENPIVELSAEESWKLLENCQHGRIALSVANEPDIYPINFVARNSILTMRTNPGTKMAELTINNHVAFEADGITSDEAWSVIARGTARVLESQSEIVEADKLPLTPWLPTLKYTYVQIKPTKVTGRRFIFGREPDRY